MAANVIKIGLDELPGALDLGEERTRHAIAAGALAGAHRGRAFMVPRTPSDMGQLRASWKVTARSDTFGGIATDLAELINDAPHVGIVEMGSRPHRVSPEGWQAIYEWVRRHYRGGKLGGAGRMRPRGRGAQASGPFKGDDPVLTSITNAIVFKIRKFGTKATLFVRNSLDELRALMATELQRSLAIVAQRGGAR